jgi:hypothetical protein
MDVSPCNSLLDLWFIALVLSRTLNGSLEGKETSRTIRELKGRHFFAGLFILFSPFDALHCLAPSFIHNEVKK